jgi:hypothetical protein
MPTTQKRLNNHATTVRMASGQRVYSHSLADPEVADRVAAFQQRIVNNPEMGMKLLREAGILTPTGRLSKKFGG